MKVADVSISLWCHEKTYIDDDIPLHANRYLLKNNCSRVGYMDFSPDLIVSSRITDEHAKILIQTDVDKPGAWFCVDGMEWEQTLRFAHEDDKKDRWHHVLIGQATHVDETPEMFVHNYGVIELVWLPPFPQDKESRHATLALNKIEVVDVEESEGGGEMVSDSETGEGSVTR